MKFEIEFLVHCVDIIRLNLAVRKCKYWLDFQLIVFYLNLDNKRVDFFQRKKILWSYFPENFPQNFSLMKQNVFFAAIRLKRFELFGTKVLSNLKKQPQTIAIPKLFSNRDTVKSNG